MAGQFLCALASSLLVTSVSVNAVFSSWAPLQRRAAQVPQRYIRHRPVSLPGSSSRWPSTSNCFDTFLGSFTQLPRCMCLGKRCQGIAPNWADTRYINKKFPFFFLPKQESRLLNSVYYIHPLPLPSPVLSPWQERPKSNRAFQPKHYF